MKAELNEKQLNAVKFFIETRDEKEALILAGYTEHYANTNSSRYFKMGKVKEYLEKMTETPCENKSDKKIASSEEVFEYLSEVMRGIGEDISVRERMKAADLLAKRYESAEKAKPDIKAVIVKDDVIE